EFDPIAEEYAQKAITLDPKLPLVHFFLGELHLYKSRVPEAIADFQSELALNPGHAQTYYKLADAYSRIQKFDDAERLLQRSIWLDSTSTGPYILMGKVLQKKGENELAVRALQHALGMDPNNSVTHHLLGQAYRDMGRTEDAERELKIAQQLNSAGGQKKGRVESDKARAASRVEDPDLRSFACSNAWAACSTMFAGNLRSDRPAVSRSAAGNGNGRQSPHIQVTSEPGLGSVMLAGESSSQRAAEAKPSRFSIDSPLTI